MGGGGHLASFGNVTTVCCLVGGGKASSSFVNISLELVGEVSPEVFRLQSKSLHVVIFRTTRFQYLRLASLVACYYRSFVFYLLLRYYNWLPLKWLWVLPDFLHGIRVHCRSLLSISSWFYLWECASRLRAFLLFRDVRRKRLILFWLAWRLSPKIRNFS